MKTTLLNRMGNFVLGGGTGVAVALTGLALWTGTTDLQAIKQAVVQLDSQAEGQAQAFVDNYKVTVESANAEIGEYKVALQQANDNIDTLITAYMNAETEHQTEVSNLQKTHEEELKQAQASAENDLKELQTKLAEMETRLDSQYATDMNEIVEKANEQINQANTEVGETKTYVDEVLKNSRTNGKVQDRIAETGKVLDVEEGTPTVNDITGIVE